MLKAGFARELITPGPDVSLIGYDYRQRCLPPGNAGVHDPLYVRALAIEGDSDGLAILISLDLCVIHRSFARELRQAIAAALDTPVERIIISCTHTHSGPYPLSEDERRHLTSADHDINAWLVKLNDAELAYPELVTRAVRTAAVRAAGKLYHVTASAQQAPLGLGYNRRVPLADPANPIAMCWSPAEQSHLDPGPITDPTCSVLELRQTHGSRRYILFNIAAHGTVMGKTSRLVSADWPGAACRLLEAYEPNSRAMFLFGACGDVHPWIATQEDPALIEPVGRAAASMVSLLTHGLRPDREEPDRFAIRAITHQIGQSEMDLAAWQIGPATIAAAPVELFGELGMSLRSRVSGPLLLATCSNGFEGYWPTAAAFAEGNYEVNAARAYQREPGMSEALIDTLADLSRRVANHSTDDNSSG